MKVNGEVITSEDSLPDLHQFLDSGEENEDATGFVNKQDGKETRTRIRRFRKMEISESDK